MTSPATGTRAETDDGVAPILPVDIDGSFVPCARADVASVLVGGEVALGRIAPGTSYLQTGALNRSASVIWQCFDGDASIEEIARDIADVYGADLAAVTADVRTVACDVGAAGFLAGVAADVDLSSEPEGLAVGSPIPAFRATSDDGRPWSSDELTARSSVIVNWSATCEHCARITDDLAALAPRLVNAGVELVLLATGGLAANRKLLDRSGLACRLVLQDDDRAEAFDGLGTPVAYLVDATARVAAPIALGADEVVALVERIAG
jgi:peroxiredoxin